MVSPKVEDLKLKKVTLSDGIIFYVDEQYNIYSKFMQLLTQQLNNKGYYTVPAKTVNNCLCNRLVHRILAQAFLKPDLDNTYEVHHKDKNPLNNSLDNLEPMLRHDHHIEHQQIYPLTKICKVCGKEFTPKPTKRKRAQVCSTECKKVIDNQTALNRRRAVNQYDLDGNFIKHWECSNEIQNELGYATSSICKCCKGVLLKAYGFKWKYADINEE